MALEVERGFEVQANSHYWASVIWLIAPPASPTAFVYGSGFDAGWAAVIASKLGSYMTAQSSFS